MTTPSAENISGVLTNWLQTEIEESDDSRNTYLSDFLLRKADFSKRFDDPTNANTQKAKSHYSQLRLWADQYVEFDSVSDDRSTARLIFRSLMSISGGYRKQCMMESETTDEYFYRRHNEGPTGVDVVGITRAELEKTDSLPNDRQARIHNMIGRTHSVNETNLAIQRYIHATPRDQGVSQYADMSPVEAVQLTQQLWTGLAVGQIIVAASFRDGDYGQVPFFEPKSITDQTRLIYPFAS